MAAREGEQTWKAEYLDKHVALLQIFVVLLDETYNCRRMGATVTRLGVPLYQSCQLSRIERETETLLPPTRIWHQISRILTAGGCDQNDGRAWSV